MTKEITIPDTEKLVENKDWYQSLIEDCQGILIEGIWNYRLTLIKTYHLLGKRILEENDNFKREEIYGEKICSQVSNSLGKSRQTIQRAIQFYKKYPDLELLPEGKNISWHKICNVYLPKTKEKPIELPKGKYQVIYADPPWQFNNEGFAQSAEQKYPTMSIKEICDIPIKEKIGEKAVLFLWVTNAFLEEGLSVCKEWGFNYKTNMVWIKKKGPTIGWFTKSRHELLFIATKGEGMHPKEKFNSWFESKVTKHSKKPEIIYEMIKKMYKGPYLELFARSIQKRKGWTYWGNEMPNK
tara:strand:- start:1540 stop:2430 length:891 start_codon:yes stop_codon:yes gene_type:complete